MTYLADLRREVEFVLVEWLGCADDPETLAAVLDLSERLAAERFATCYRSADVTEPVLEHGAVRILPAMADALRTYGELGLFGAAFDPALGGMGLSAGVAAASFLLFAAANISASAYAMLSGANARLLARFGTPAQVDAFARPQIEGRWLGTMCLSETQAGSNLGDVLTRAQPEGEDALGSRYRLYGAKMWISGADHDAADNILHLVLAKVVDEAGRLAPGTKGISLFAVPKLLPGGERNDAFVTGLNHKLGYRGIPNCVLGFGDGMAEPDGRAGAIGWRIGAEGDGLRQMFRMMNEARIGVSLGAAALGYRAFRQALRYAGERIQGRPAGAARDAGDRVAIRDHPDVRRMLLRQKVLSEGAVALALFCASLDEADPGDAALLALLTPVAKSWTSTWTLVANDLAIQVHGGYGYTRDFDVEQLWRDNRLNPIHEGTNGIQAIDLVERKLLAAGEDPLAGLRQRIGKTAAAAAAREEFAALGAELKQAWEEIEAAVAALGRMAIAARLGLASQFCDAMGHVIVAWLWLDQALACTAADDDYRRGKRRACAAFFGMELPAISSWLAPVLAGADTLPDLSCALT